jgi:hypothetical protein
VTPTVPIAPSGADLPTQAMSWHDVPRVPSPPADLPTVPYAPPVDAPPVWDPFEGVPPLPPVPAPASTSEAPHDPTSAIDSLFGDTQFREYEELSVLETITPPVADPAARAVPRQPREPSAPISSTQKTLMWVAGGLVAALALVALFMLGTRLGAEPAVVPKALPTTSASAAPSTAPTTGPAAAGAHPWTALNGGECIQPFTSAWAETFTVVDCSADHDAQLIARGTLPDGDGTAYPSAEQFASEVTPLCTAPSVLDYGTAKGATDVQLSIAYPPSSDDWTKGDRGYFCFVTRASGGNLPGDLAATSDN